MICTTAAAQTDAWVYADSMMQSTEGQIIYDLWMQGESEITDSLELEALASTGTMYHYMSEWYANHDPAGCLAVRSPESLACYNQFFTQSEPEDDFLEGWRLSDALICRIVSVYLQDTVIRVRVCTSTVNCTTELLGEIPLPDEARPTESENSDPYFRFNLNPNDNRLISQLFPSSIRPFANYMTFEIYQGEQDVKIPELLPVNPPSGSRSVRIGDDHNQYHVNTMRRQFQVQPGDAVWYFSYAFVMEDPGHGANFNPFFRAVLKDGACNIVESKCFIADVNDPGMEAVFVPGWRSPVVYRPWTCDSFDLRDHVGDFVTIEFTSADCGLGAHFGYAYVADLCELCGQGPKITLDSAQYICPRFPMEFCGELWIDTSYTFIDLTLEITQNLVVWHTFEPSSYDPQTGSILL